MEPSAMSDPSFNPTYGNDGNDGRDKGRYASWLLIRYTGTDIGARPLPSGTVFWESPDVWVESSLGINQPVVGQPNHVFARVTNLGWKSISNVFVDFWWANPSLAITTANATKIGTGSAAIPSGYTVTVPCPVPWVPVLENGGHECLLAEAYSPIYDPLTAPLDPVEDRHVGQKNEYLVTLAPGEQFRFTVRAGNVAGLRQEVSVTLYPLILSTLPPLLALRADGLRHSYHDRAEFTLRPPQAVLPVDLRLAEETLAFEGASTFFARRLLSLSAAQAAGAARFCGTVPQIGRQAEFAPWEARKVEISGMAPPGARPGDSFCFRVEQSAAGIVTGGYTLTIVIV
jgi:hypothetical protein